MDVEKLKKRTKDFAHRCVKLALASPKTQPGKHVAGQLVRCSTSVAANYRATRHAQSKAAFIHNDQKNNTRKKTVKNQQSTIQRQSTILRGNDGND